MKKHLVITAVLLIGGILNSAIAQNHKPLSQWDRSTAMVAVRSVNIDLAINEINNLEDIQALENRADWPLPAREAAIYKYTRSLASEPRDAVSPAVIQYLNTYQARTLVPAEDHPQAVVPLFNIRGAAAGVENSWIRSESASEAHVLLGTDPAALPGSYLKATNPSQRSGYLDATRQADLASVKAIQLAALDQLGTSPELTPLVAVTTAITQDPYATRRLLIDGSGAGLAAALDTLGAQYSAAESAVLMKFAIEQAPVTNAALAIAAWWPALHHDAATRQLLIDKLADPALGSSVALALAQNPDIQTIRELQLIADGNSIAARRAQMALNISHDGLIGEVQK